MKPQANTRANLARRLEEIRTERISLGRPALRFSLKTSAERRGLTTSKREIDEWKALHPELERRHAELVAEELELESRLQEAERRERIEARLSERLQLANAGERSTRHALAPEPRPALEAVRSWFDAKPRPWALVLCGTTGTGKTVAGVWAMAESLRNGETVASRTPTDIGRMPLYRSARERDEFKHLSRAIDLLLIDDLGAYPLTESGRGLLLELLNARYEASARTVMTSNLDARQLQALLGERTWDRFRDGGRVVDVSGQSMRGQR